MSSTQAAQGRQIDAQPSAGASVNDGTEKGAGDSWDDVRPSRMPADWWPDAQQLEQARERYTLIDVDAETRKYVATMSASRKRRKSWLSAWRGTMIAEHREQAHLVVEAVHRAERRAGLRDDTGELVPEAVPVPDPERAAAEAAANGGRPRLRVVRNA